MNDVGHKDRAELDRFATYCRLVAEAERAGVPGTEAAAALYQDVYDSAPMCPCEQCEKIRGAWGR